MKWFEGWCMKHNERARVAPLPFVHRKIHERPPAAGGRLRRPAACGLRPPAATVRHTCARLRRGRSGLTMPCRFELPLCDACAARVRAFAQRGGRSRRRRPWRLPPPRAFVTLPPALPPALPSAPSPALPPALPPTLSPTLPPLLKFPNGAQYYYWPIKNRIKPPRRAEPLLHPRKWRTREPGF